MLLNLKQHQEFLLVIGSKIVNVTRSVRLLGITADYELKLDKHVEVLCRKVCKGSQCILKGCISYGREEKEVLYYAFIKSNFNYCPLIWMLCGKNTAKNRLCLQKSSEIVS